MLLILERAGKTVNGQSCVLIPSCNAPNGITSSIEQRKSPTINDMSDERRNLKRKPSRGLNDSRRQDRRASDQSREMNDATQRPRTPDYLMPDASGADESEQPDQEMTDAPQRPSPDQMETTPASSPAGVNPSSYSPYDSGLPQEPSSSSHLPQPSRGSADTRTGNSSFDRRGSRGESSSPEATILWPPSMGHFRRAAEERREEERQGREIDAINAMVSPLSFSELQDE